jgi:hypothetical protein
MVATEATGVVLIPCKTPHIHSDYLVSSLRLAVVVRVEC